MAVGYQSEMRLPEPIPHFAYGRHEHVKALRVGRYSIAPSGIPLIASGALNLVRRRRHMAAQWAMVLNTTIVSFS